MNLDTESGNLVGIGEVTTLSILKRLTGLKEIKRKLFFINPEAIFTQIPITYILGPEDLTDLSEPHKKGSLDIFIKTKNGNIAVRVQGPGHGQGTKIHGKYTLKGPGKSKHDDVQKDILKKYCQVVDIEMRECPIVFKERDNQTSEQEIRDSFKTARVELPSGRNGEQCQALT